jgi:hypothetical protein
MVSFPFLDAYLSSLETLAPGEPFGGDQISGWVRELGVLLLGSFFSNPNTRLLQELIAGPRLYPRLLSLLERLPATQVRNRDLAMLRRLGQDFPLPLRSQEAP